MPLSYQIEDGLLLYTTVGGVDYQHGLAVLSAGLAQYAGTKPAPPMVLFDLTRSTENRSNGELQGIAAVVARQLPGARIALAVGSDFHYGLSRMFAAHLDDAVEAIKVFRDPSAARSWLRDVRNGSASDPR